MSNDYRVLIVDDEPRNIDILKVKLEAEGFETLTAADGESAVFAFEQHLPDMVLLDVMMPGVDGREVCRALKERSGNVFVPIILVTAMTGGEDKAEGFAAGADDYITKPVDFTELLARIKNLRRLQSMAHQDRKRTIEFPTYKAGSAPLDETFKVLADGMGAEQKTMYRITSSEGRVAYIGIEGHKVIHIRADGLAGREALDQVLLWPVEKYESVVMKIIKPNLDVTFQELTGQLLERLDVWRMFSEKLTPKTTLLKANVRRAGELDGSKAELIAALKLFYEPVSIHQALRASELEAPAAMRAIGELYYRGLLQRHGEPPAGARWLGAPLVTQSALSPQTAETASPAVAAAAPAATPAEPPAEALELQKQIDELRIEVASLNASNDGLREENAELRGKVQAASAEPKEAPSAETDAVRKLLAEKERECMALGNQLIAASAKNEAQASRVQELQTRVATLERNGGKPAPDVLKLQSTLMEYEEELARLRQEAAAKAEGGQNGGAPASDWVEELESLRAQLKTRDAEIVALKQSLDEAKVVDLMLEDENDIDPETGLAKPDESSKEVRALKATVKQRDGEIVALREQIVAAASQFERQSFVVQELNRLLDEQKREYERRISVLQRNMGVQS